jgi:hypothetical protein
MWEKRWNYKTDNKQHGNKMATQPDKVQCKFTASGNMNHGMQKTAWPDIDIAFICAQPSTQHTLNSDTVPKNFF